MTPAPARSPPLRTKGREGLELLRILKRAIVREVYRHLTHSHTTEDIQDLRTGRQAKNITLSAVATALDTSPMRISRLERGIVHDSDFANQYRTRR